MERRIRAHYTAEGVVVYQAFKPETVAHAVAVGTFGRGFTFDRFSWIKPSFGWILHRSEWATKHRMEAIARVWITHDGFREILRRAVSTIWEPTVHADESDWARELDGGDVRYQWDPEREPSGAKNGLRAIQLGLRGEALRRFVEDWIIRVDDATELAHQVGAVARARVHGMRLPSLPLEREYPVDDALAVRLAYVGAAMR